MDKNLRIGRPVRITSISFGNGYTVDEIQRVMEAEGEKGTDLIILPETWTGTELEEPGSPAVRMCSAIAARYRTYVVCPVFLRDEQGRRWNTVIFLDRQGNSVFSYRKYYPYWSEFDLTPPSQPGNEVEVFKADFGKIGFAICFDVNFPEVWDKLAEGGAELVIWPSAYSGGRALMAHAVNHHYYIVTSTQEGDCAVFDITGEEILYEKSQGVNVSRVTLDLDRCIFHENFNMDKRDKLLQEHPGEVVQELHMQREQWFVLKAAVPGISVKKLAAEYGMEELGSYLRRSRAQIDEMRRSRNVGV
ncbi:MAG: carbon-nitrogen hydrolase family protein [Clostridiales bacterium]|jgi:predicted amidohydrolase|nr:carbon-nitrogen hydrolase family protein [Clostridiales bacterium]